MINLTDQAAINSLQESIDTYKHYREACECQHLVADCEALTSKILRAECAIEMIHRFSRGE